MSVELSEIDRLSETLVRHLKETAAPDDIYPQKTTVLPDGRTLDVHLLSPSTQDVGVLEIALLPKNPDQIGYSTGQFVPTSPQWASTGGLYNFGIYDNFETGRPINIISMTSYEFLRRMLPRYSKLLKEVHSALGIPS